ncbi:MAG: class I SAM-dependent methyltransferase [Deltaproteobacteria bacterium]|nr:class I SAM-dependent methyltransferase [Deltaproteobacteria bacterium]RLC12268.1 MAG: SAM-dependent methyltransferase [Deltaproteobacteria bacterium]
MAAVFGEYSVYYDLLYKDKDYGKECDYLEYLWTQYSDIPVKSVLDLGCGTGRHSIDLTQRGFDVLGIDRSEKMLAQAVKGAEAKGLKIDFRKGDIAGFEGKKTFDSAISMFAVIGYLTSNGELLSAFKTIRRHLKKGALFIFDVWYGPAVLNQKPSERLRIAGDGAGKIYRFACPKINALKNTVRVDYVILKQGATEEVRESHIMRYFFIPELKLIAKMCDFEFIKALSFLSKKAPPSLSSWNMTCIFKAI